MDHSIKTEALIPLTSERRDEMLAELEKHVRYPDLYRLDKAGWYKNLAYEKDMRKKRGETPAGPLQRYDYFVHWISSEVSPFRRMGINELMRYYGVPYERAWMMKCINDGYEELVVRWIKVR